jgi:hypothetical protein
MKIVPPNVKKVNQKTCQALSYVGFGEEIACKKPAAYTINTGTVHEFPMCADCAKDAHPNRLQIINTKGGNDER